MTIPAIIRLNLLDAWQTWTHRNMEANPFAALFLGHSLLFYAIYKALITGIMCAFCLLSGLSWLPYVLAVFFLAVVCWNWYQIKGRK